MTKQPSQNRRIIVAVSGTGRSLANLIEKSASFNFEITGVIASNPSCRGVEVAKSAGIPLFIGNYSSDNLSNSQKEQWEFVRQLQPQLVVLAGFLKKFPLNQETTFDSPQIINIHPSLLPKFGGNGFYGEKVHKAVIDANEAYSGATVHFVDQEYDTGTLISFAKLVINPMETPESLSLRVFELEKNLLPTTISMLLDHQLPLHDKSWELVL